MVLFACSAGLYFVSSGEDDKKIENLRHLKFFLTFALDQNSSDYQFLKIFFLILISKTVRFLEDVVKWVIFYLLINLAILLKNIVFEFLTRVITF